MELVPTLIIVGVMWAWVLFFDARLRRNIEELEKRVEALEERLPAARDE